MIRRLALASTALPLLALALPSLLAIPAMGQAVTPTPGKLMQWGMVRPSGAAASVPDTVCAYDRQGVCQTIGSLPQSGGPFAPIGLTTVSVTALGAKCNGLNADGSQNTSAADDTTALNAAFTAAPATSTRLLIPAGKQCNAKQLILPSNTDLVDNGILFQIAANNTDFLTTNTSSGTTSNISISGTGTINGNRANQAAQSASNPAACLNLYNVSGVNLSGITITQCPKFPFNIWGQGSVDYAGAVNVAVRDVTMSYSGNSPEFVNCTNCWGYNLTSHHIDDYAFSFYQGVKYGGLVGGTFNYSAGGVSVLTDAPGGRMSYDVKVIGASASYNDGPGFITWNNGGPTNKQHQYVQFVDWHGDHNHLDAKKSGSQNFGGLWMQACDNCTSNGWSSEFDGAQANEVSPCVFLANLVTHPHVTNGKCKDEGQGGGTGVGISVSSDTVEPIVTNNDIEDDQSTHTMAFALNGGIGQGNRGLIAHNRFFGGFLGSPDNMTYGTDTTRFDNGSVPGFMPGDMRFGGKLTVDGGASLGSQSTAGNVALGFYSSGSNQPDTYVLATGGTAGQPGKGYLSHYGLQDLYFSQFIAKNGIVVDSAGTGTSPANGTAAASLCIDGNGVVYRKTTSGPCL